MNGYRYDIGAIQFDVIIVGAGINGAAIARDAAMRGLQVLLVDKGDVSAGTTSWSTRLIHGGLRYLEHFEVPLVRESLHERGTLLWTAPHLVRPLHFLIPLYAEGSRRAGLIRLGMVSATRHTTRGCAPGYRGPRRSPRRSRSASAASWPLP